MILQKEAAFTRGVVGNLVDALAELGILVRQELRAHTDVARPPCRAAVVGAVATAGRHRDDHPVLVRRIGHDRMQTHSAAARRPLWTMRMIEQSVDGAPALAAVARLEERGGFDTGPHHLGLIPRAGHDLPDLRQ